MAPSGGRRPARKANASRTRLRNPRGEGVLLRDEIVEAATRLLRERGDGGDIGLRAVAREAGVSAPAIYDHFPDTDAIVAAVVAGRFVALLGTLRTAAKGHDDPVERLRAQCDAYLRFAEAEPGLYRVLFDRSRRIADPSSGATNRVGRRVDSDSSESVILAAGTPAFRMLVDVITACVDAGRSASNDPFVDAVGLWCALHGYCLLRVAAPEFPWPDERTTVEAIIIGQARICSPAPGPDGH